MFYLIIKRLISIDIEKKTISNLKGHIDDLLSINCLKIEKDWICATLQGYNRMPSLVLILIINNHNKSNKY